MRLESESGVPHEGEGLWVVLTETEARDLAEGLIMYFAEEPRDPGWHDHLGDHLTLGIEPADTPLGIRLGLDGEARTD